MCYSVAITAIMKEVMGMNAKSHKLLGRYLVDKYLADQPRRFSKAFLIGCIEPDRNPTTYLKGSIRSHWLRGHNWSNAQRFMDRISQRLEKKEKLGLLDYYALGKLIHYTMDSFTYAHNEHFNDNLRQHRTYERLLHRYFSRYLPGHKESRLSTFGSVMSTIRHYHSDYMDRPAGVFNDTKFTINVCGLVMDMLLTGVPSPC